MTTLLHISDLHFNQPYFDWIAQQQEQHAVICITGDFLDTQENNLTEQIDWIKQWFNHFKIPVFICSGNHDIVCFEQDNWFNEIDNPLIFSDESITKIQGLTIACYPYIGGMGYEEYSACDILLHHIPPAHTSIAKTQQNEDWGDRALYQALKQGIMSPQLVLSGHIHKPKAYEDKLRNTRLINPGVNNNSTPQFQIINLADLSEQLATNFVPLQQKA